MDSRFTDLHEKRTKLFRQDMKDNKDIFVRSLTNTIAVCKGLCVRGILPDSELERLQASPSVWIQKQKLMNSIMQKDFKDLETIKHVLEETKNKDLKILLEFIREKILEEYPDEAEKSTAKEGASDGNSLAMVPHYINKGPHDSDARQFQISNGFSFKPSRPGPVNGHSKILEPLLVTEIFIENYTKCSDCTFWKFFTAASAKSLHMLEKLIDSDEKFEQCESCRGPDGQTVLHAAVLQEKFKGGSDRTEMVLEKLRKDLSEQKFEEMLNKQDKFGQTAIHLAAINERSEVVEKLYYDYYSNILIKDRTETSALELINMNLPRIAWKMLNNETLAANKNRDVQDGGNLTIDFGKIIGYPLLPQKKMMGYKETYVKMEENYTEMTTLRKYIECFETDDCNLLYHVMVKLFIELKWKKMRRFLFCHMIFKVFVYLWYTLFVVHVFLVKCRISSHVDATNPPESVSETDAIDKSFLNYLFGDWEVAVQALTGIFDIPISDDQKGNKICVLDSKWVRQCYVSLFLGISLAIKEIGGIVVLSKIQCKKQSWENRFQMVFSILMILVGTLVFHTEYMPNYYYSYAALSIVVTWVLIFIQMGYLTGQGIYVQLLGKIVFRFVSLILNYMCWMIAFAIALSIVLPQAKPFETLPKSLLKVITMMSGELEYENAFYGDGDDEKDGRNGTGTESAGGTLPSIVFTAHIIYTSVVLLLTIILSNALIGLAVDDVRQLQQRSEVLLEYIKVDKMYKMEAVLLLLQRSIFPCLRNFLKFIFMIKPECIWKNGKVTGNGMVYIVPIKDIPGSLYKEIREFDLRPEEYNFKLKEKS